MVKTHDFDRKMLLLATHLANETDMKRLLLSVLEALLESVQTQDGGEIHPEAITLIRCIVRLVLKLVDESGSGRYVCGSLRIRQRLICHTCATSVSFVSILIGHLTAGAPAFLAD